MMGGSLRGILEAVGADLDSAQRADAGGAIEWSLEGVVFAMVDDDRAEFRLDPAVAAAALRTPDTAPSARGRDWVAFAPPTLDQHAVDRATAWLASAQRRAQRRGEA
jgi:hypothetical protein